MNRLLIEVGAVLLLLCGFALYERHQGAQGCLKSDAALDTRTEIKNARAEGVGGQNAKQEGLDYVEVLHSPVAPTPRVHPAAQPPRSCRRGAPGSGADSTV